MIGRTIASGIGLAREAALSKKDSKEAENKDVQTRTEGTESGNVESSLLTPDPLRPTSSSGGMQQDHDDHNEQNEYLWDLDDIQRAEMGVSQPFTSAQNEEELIQEFQRMHPPPYTEKTGQLPCPVCIPQRRPRHRTRGFIRAYAPVLKQVGIDQAMFLDFIAGFEQAIKVCSRVVYRDLSNSDHRCTRP